MVLKYQKICVLISIDVENSLLQEINDNLSISLYLGQIYPKTQSYFVKLIQIVSHRINKVYIYIYMSLYNLFYKHIYNLLYVVNAMFGNEVLIL